MTTRADAMLEKLEPLPVRLRIAHLAALLRREGDGSTRAAELEHLLAIQTATRGGRAG